MARKGGGAEGEGLQVVAVNKRARRDYEILDTIEAGLVLLGSEVKSVRDGGINLQEAYVRAKSGELFLVDCHISPYSYSRQEKYEPTRDRKLLMHRREIDRLALEIQKKGLSIIPLRAYFKRGRCKIELGVGRGKKLWDKRQDVKAREAQRMVERAIKRR